MFPSSVASLGLGTAEETGCSPQHCVFLPTRASTALASQRHGSSSASQLYRFFFTVEQFFQETVSRQHTQRSAGRLWTSLPQWPASPTSRECGYSQRFPQSQRGERLPECQLGSGYGGPQPPSTSLASSAISWALKQMLPNKIECSSQFLSENLGPGAGTAHSIIWSELHGQHQALVF